MVSQVIVAVADCNVKRHAPEELLEIRCYVIFCALLVKELREFKVAAAFALVLAKHRHGGRVEMAPRGHSIEAPRTEGMEMLLEGEELRWRNIDAGVLCQAVSEVFPRADVALVVAARKLRDPEAAVGLGEIGFRTCTAEGSSRCYQHREPPAQGVKVADVFARELDRHTLELSQAGDRRCG